jgi:hypothetical protein
MATSLFAQSGPPSPSQEPQKVTASSILLERIVPPEDMLIPEDTRVSMYENVISELVKTKKFHHVYRVGDRDAAAAPDLVTLRLIPEVYKPGSQKEREVITIAGATSIKVRLQFITRDGKIPIEKEVSGRVRFYGENLRATNDLAKKVAGVVNKSF